MAVIHIHEVLDLIYESNDLYTIETLNEAVSRKFGKDVTLTSCADNRFGIEGMIQFMVERGKITVLDNTIYPAGTLKCDH